MTAQSEMPVMRKARIAGAFYLLVFLTGGAAVLINGGLFTSSGGAATVNNILLHEPRFWLVFTFNLLVIASYLAVTALFYELFRPVSRLLSLQAAIFSIVGSTVQAGALAFYAGTWMVLTHSSDQTQALTLLGLQLYVQAYNIGLGFFGFYCLLIGYLIFRSPFLPRALGLLLMFGGLSWLTFLSPPLASHLRPFNVVPGVLGEASLTLWLLLAGVDARRWTDLAARLSVQRGVAE